MKIHLSLRVLWVFCFCFMLGFNGFAEPLKVCLVSGSAEYESDVSLPIFMQYLEERYNIECTLLHAEGFENLPGLEALDECDTALFFTRRLTITGEQLERVKQYIQSGKPVVAVRTASHGFQNFLEFDREVLGGNYTGHHGGSPKRMDSLTQSIVIEPDAKDHPALAGVSRVMRSLYSLYKTGPLAPDAVLLMNGSIPGQKPEPVTWVREHNGGRVFYTAMGGVEDFENDSFKRLLANALYWTARRDLEAKPLSELTTREKKNGRVTLPLRSRFEPFKGSEEWHEVNLTHELSVAETAIVICDMWDKHWCQGATVRVGEMVPRMEEVIDAARQKGVMIIHAPSDTMYFYSDSPQRLRMTAAPDVPKPELKGLSDPPLPIDDSDEGCDTDDKPYSAWTRQHTGLTIAEQDGISDSGDEIYNYFQQAGIKNIIIMGVHTNMCVLGRSFAIRNMTRWGIPCVLVRDLTDTMYDPKDFPFVPHEQGTELVVQHIEKYWCPSVTSEELLASLR